MERTDLTDFGFIQESSVLKCRVCGKIIRKYYVTKLLGTSVKYGYCRHWTHGVSVCKESL